ncbi:phosphohydrolase [Rhodoferax lacus]|uniref:Phosphohydrolase n=1 Tax=Rhodoferax lacus TaxID=2184758 RepID=A0A3E1RH87_9BURK|nr:HD-GYP domain-containing protein [Rhodoferax lacus]RFO98718.1 phosphohydrolase [Rhodoferax lacus]
MNKDSFAYVSARDLRIGLFVDLELGWIDHPFASGRFKISSDEQIRVLKGLAADRFRFVPSRSEWSEAVGASPSEVQEESLATNLYALGRDQKVQQLRMQRQQAVALQQEGLADCERRFTDTARQYHHTLDLLHSQPIEAARVAQQVVQQLVVDIEQQGDSALRLLNDSAADKVALHPVNVTVISLLLGQALGLQDLALKDLGLAAFLHDVGKCDLPERLRRPDDTFSTVERNAYQSHVENSVRLAQAMGLSQGAIQAVAQHHELADGSGFPQHLKLDAIGMGARILALVNRYDGLCNPAKPSHAMTPHEALATIFSQQKKRFDPHVLSAFVRMVGVYPPGSLVQLNDERHAMVVGVNAARPLKPRVIVHEPGTPRHEALILDLEGVANAGIRRSVKPESLSTAAQEYLQPRQRLCYFLETAIGPVPAEKVSANATGPAS